MSAALAKNDLNEARARSALRVEGLTSSESGSMMKPNPSATPERRGTQALLTLRANSFKEDGDLTPYVMASPSKPSNHSTSQMAYRPSLRLLTSTVQQVPSVTSLLSRTLQEQLAWARRPAK